jgi:hypothetical protein
VDDGQRKWLSRVSVTVVFMKHPVVELSKIRFRIDRALRSDTPTSIDLEREPAVSWIPGLLVPMV